MKKKRGFLLIELLVALSIFLIFVFFITKYQSVCFNNSLLAVKKIEALNLALNTLALENESKFSFQTEKQGFEIIKKEVNCNLGLNNIALYLNNLLGPSFIFDLKAFKFHETIVLFDLFNGKKGEIQIRSG